MYFQKEAFLQNKQKVWRNNWIKIRDHSSITSSNRWVGGVRKWQFLMIYSTLQSLTGKYRGLQGNPCNENRDPAMRTGVPCNENRFFPVRIDLQGVPCKPYRVWVCNVL
jgi:hypothetical protein